MKRTIDYTLYLVTDRELMSAPALETAVEAALKGGVSLVQLREKTADAAEFIRIAKNIKKITDAYNTPLIINDRPDIAAEINAAGVHIGQDDITPEEARKVIGPGKILGLSASNLPEALDAQKRGADYLGIGAMFATGTKADARLTSIEELKKIRQNITIPLVVIGGINKTTLPLFEGTGIDGVCAVSAIISQPGIEAAAREIKEIFLGLRK